jgi:hypothetical protein
MSKDLLTLKFKAEHELTPQFSLLPNGMATIGGVPMGMPGLPSLGVMYEIDVTPGMNSMFHSVPVIKLVQPGSPAQKAGLLPGDRILSVGNMHGLANIRGVPFDQFSYLLKQTFHAATMAGGQMILQVERFPGGGAVQVLLAAVGPRSSMLFSIGRSLEARCDYAHLLDALKHS